MAEALNSTINANTMNHRGEHVAAYRMDTPREASAFDPITETQPYSAQTQRTGQEENAEANSNLLGLEMWGGATEDEHDRDLWLSMMWLVFLVLVVVFLLRAAREGFPDFIN